MSKIQVVLLDIGGVVLELNWSSVTCALKPDCSSNVEGLPELIKTWEAYDHYERGHKTTQEFFELLSKNLQYSKTLDQLQSHWNKLIVAPIKGVDQVLASVSKNARLLGLSNVNDAHLKHISATFPVLKQFERIFASCELGCRKPEEKIFQSVLTHLNVSPSSVLFVDDTVCNLETAKKLGIHAEHCLNSSSRLREIFIQYNVLN